MILCVDIGNSNIVLGAYKNDELQFCARISTARSLEAAQYALEISGILGLYGVKTEKIDGIMLSSVVPRVTDAIINALAIFTKAKPVILSRENSNIDANIDTPSELGADIIATAVSVKNSMELPAIIIDMGTATTITAMDAKGVVQGVSIMPGLYISLDALQGRTSQLKGISISTPASAIGKNTSESMKSGILFGYADMLDGMITRFEKEMPGVKTIVATGGAAELVLPHCTHKIINSPSLLLDGLYAAFLRVANEQVNS